MGHVDPCDGEEAVLVHTLREKTTESEIYGPVMGIITVVPHLLHNVKALRQLAASSYMLFAWSGTSTWYRFF